MEASIYQQAIYKELSEGKGHVVVVARAGCGKTTTIIEGLSHIPMSPSRTTLLVAFNKSISEELQARAPQRKGLFISTLHSFGLKAIRMTNTSVKIDGDKVSKILIAKFGTEKNFEFRQCVTRLVSLAKGTLATTSEEIIDLMTEFSLEPPVKGVKEAAEARTKIVLAVLETLTTCREMTGTVDFDDMIWFPVVLNMKAYQYNDVLVDEAQDLNACQLELVLRAVKRGGRVIAVGDDRQAIYQFRGADKDALGNIINRLKAKTLPLSITYRCGKEIVKVAQEIVPDFEAGENNPQGEVCTMRMTDMLRQVGPGDFVLSRTNAALIGSCLKLLGMSKPACIAGRDIGKTLRTLVEKANVDSTQELNAWVDQWEAIECTRLLQAGKPATSIEDRAACIRVLSENTRHSSEVIAKIELLFSDDTNEKRVVCSSTHKAKGLERDNVFLLRDTYMRPRRGKKGVMQPVSEEEKNLFYVAVTRAKKRLVMVLPDPPIQA